jgi:hypothetical protein
MDPIKRRRLFLIAGALGIMIIICCFLIPFIAEQLAYPREATYGTVITSTCACHKEKTYMQNTYGTFEITNKAGTRQIQQAPSAVTHDTANSALKIDNQSVSLTAAACGNLQLYPFSFKFDFFKRILRLHNEINLLIHDKSGSEIEFTVKKPGSSGSRVKCTYFLSCPKLSEELGNSVIINDVKRDLSGQSVEGLQLKSSNSA